MKFEQFFTILQEEYRRGEEEYGSGKELSFSIDRKNVGSVYVSCRIDQEESERICRNYAKAYLEGLHRGDIEGVASHLRREEARQERGTPTIESHLVTD